MRHTTLIYLQHEFLVLRGELLSNVQGFLTGISAKAGTDTRTRVIAAVIRARKIEPDTGRLDSLPRVILGLVKVGVIGNPTVVYRLEHHE
jgi:hypothetical protein